MNLFDHNASADSSLCIIIAIGTLCAGNQPRTASLLPFPQQFGPFGIGELLSLLSGPLAVPSPHQHVHHKGNEDSFDYYMDGIFSDQCDPPRSVLLGQGKEHVGQAAEVGRRCRGGATG